MGLKFYVCYDPQTQKWWFFGFQNSALKSSQSLKIDMWVDEDKIYFQIKFEISTIILGGDIGVSKWRFSVFSIFCQKMTIFQMGQKRSQREVIEAQTNLFAFSALNYPIKYIKKDFAKISHFSNFSHFSGYYPCQNEVKFEVNVKNFKNSKNYWQHVLGSVLAD